MQKTKQKSVYFFVDESGDPVFYDKYNKLILDKSGVSKMLIIGFIATDNPKKIRKALEKTKNEIVQDEYLKGIPSLKKSVIAFHAKDDCPEIREKVFKTIKDLDFSAEFYVARKNENTFNKRFHRNENEFYDYLITELFKNKLHLASDIKIYFAVRGSSPRQKPIEDAINKAKTLFEEKHGSKNTSTIIVQGQTPSGEPCLQVIDYMNWAIQRIYTKSEDRFYRTVESKVKYLVDLYDIKKYPDNYYSKNNKFSLEKISPL